MYGKSPFSEKDLCDIIASECIEKFRNSRAPLAKENNMKQKPSSNDEAIKLMLKTPIGSSGRCSSKARKYSPASMRRW